MKYQNKPDWRVVKGEWLCQNPDGEWVSFYHKPQPDRIHDLYEGVVDYWSAAGGCSEKYGFDEVIGDWKDTLEKRPSQEEISKESEKYFEVVDQYTVYGDDNDLEIIVINTNVITNKSELDRFNDNMHNTLGKSTLTVNIGDV